MLEPRRPAAAWPRRRRPESRRRLLCSAPPLGFPGADRLAAWERVRGPHHAAAIAPPRGRRRSPPAAGLPPLRRRARHGSRLAWLGRPLCFVPLTSGAHWSVGELRGVFLLFVVNFGCDL